MSAIGWRSCGKMLLSSRSCTILVWHPSTGSALNVHASANESRYDGEKKERESELALLLLSLEDRMAPTKPIEKKHVSPVALLFKFHSAESSIAVLTAGTQGK
jgi:hypothetical protein